MNSQYFRHENPGISCFTARCWRRDRCGPFVPLNGCLLRCASHSRGDSSWIVSAHHTSPRPSPRMATTTSGESKKLKLGMYGYVGIFPRRKSFHQKTSYQIPRKMLMQCLYRKGMGFRGRHTQDSCPRSQPWRWMWPIVFWIFRWWCGVWMLSKC